LGKSLSSTEFAWDFNGILKCDRSRQSIQQFQIQKVATDTEKIIESYANAYNILKIIIAVKYGINGLVL
jgi:hypothetical protein